jgi:electron transfer flavoprotein beta subunit
MKILVAIKQVPARDSQLKIASAGRWIEEGDLAYEINEPDAYALEEGLQLKEKHGGEVVALCFGPSRAGQTIREALAKGADRALHIEAEDPGAYDPLAAARLMAAAVRAESPDLVLTGLQSDDLGYGQTGPILAELLGLPHATLIMEVEKQGRRNPGEARTGGRLVPVRGDAAARATDDSIGYQQAALRHVDGDQESEDKRGQAPDPGGAGEAAMSAASIRLDRVYLPERAKQTQLSRAARRKPRPSWWKN